LVILVLPIPLEVLHLGARFECLHASFDIPCEEFRKLCVALKIFGSFFSTASGGQRVDGKLNDSARIPPAVSPQAALLDVHAALASVQIGIPLVPHIKRGVIQSFCR